MPDARAWAAIRALFSRNTSPANKCLLGLQRNRPGLLILARKVAAIASPCDRASPKRRCEPPGGGNPGPRSICPSASRSRKPRRGKTAASPAAQRITFSRRAVGRRGQVGRRWAGQASEKGRTSRVQVGHRGEGQASGTNRRSGTGRAEGEGGRPGGGDRPGRTAPAPSHVTISGRSLPNQSAPNACPSYTTLKCLFYLAIYFR